MNNLVVQISGYIYGIWRRRWYVIAAAWAISGAGWMMVSNLPDRYEASTRIYVDMDTMLGPLMKGLAVEMNLFQQIDIMRRTLLSRPNLEKIILMTDLDLKIKGDEAKEQLVQELKAKISVKQQGRNLFQISYEDVERGVTKRVVQAVMQIFVEGNLGASRKDMETTRSFLDDQIRDYERQLIETEGKRAKFKRNNMGLLPGDRNYYEHMQVVRKKFSETTGQIEEASMIRDELVQQMKEVPQYLEVAKEDNLSFQASGGPIGPDSDYHVRILELQKTIDSLLTQYTENHPDVVSTKRRLAELQKKLDGASKAMAAANIEGPDKSKPPVAAPNKKLVSNPVYEKVKLQIVQQEGVLAALKHRAKKQKQGVERWEKMAKLVPQVEAQLAQLNRDYAIVKKGYEELRQRQESAKLARDLETKAQKVQFRIIDPPKLPVKPRGPNRPVMFVALLFAGFIVGVSVAFLLSQIKTTFTNIQKLRETFTVPVIGKISTIVSPLEKRKRLRGNIGFSLACLSLFGAFSVLVGVEVIGASKVMWKLQDLGVLDKIRGLGII